MVVVLMVVVLLVVVLLVVVLRCFHCPCRLTQQRSHIMAFF